MSFTRNEKEFTMKVYLILALIATLSAWEFVAAQTNYCQPSLCPGKRHIGCSNNGAFKSTCVSKTQVMPISSALRDVILNKHNSLRQQIASGGLSRFQPAARMATMKWDPELASLALLNAKQCVMQHDACRATAQFPHAGQNLAYNSFSGSAGKSVEEFTVDQIQRWFNENKDATMSQIKSYKSNGKTIGHFTQVAQERATHVGCGIVRDTKGSSTYQFMACNYAFSTFINKPVYATATRAASECKTGTNPSFKALCSVNEVYNVKTP